MKWEVSTNGPGFAALSIALPMGVAICRKSIALLLTVGCFALSLAARGQVADEEDVQAIRTSRGPAAAQQTADSEQAATLILERVNQFRQDQGLQPVQASRKLGEAAQSFAQYMARTNRYGHTADRQRPAERARQHGYEYCIMTENIAQQFRSAGFATRELAEQFVQGWKQSPGHRKNILDADVTETGVGVAQSPETGHYYVVQMFGRPRSHRIEFQIVNESPAAVRYQIRGQSFSLPPRYTRTHQQCRPSELTFRLSANDQEKTATMMPNSGDRFVVAQERGQIRVTRERDAGGEATP